MEADESAIIEERFENWRKRVGLVLAPWAFFAAYLLCDSLTPEGRKLSGVLATVCVLWISEAIPLPASALLGAVLCVVLGVAEAKAVLAYFADPVVFVFLGGFMLARAMSVHGLDRRLALKLLAVRGVGRSPGRVLAAMGVATAGISMWVSNTATTAMMLPIALGVLAAMHEARVARGEATGPMNARQWPYATAMMLMVAYGASIGGIGTPVGTPPNLIGIALIQKTIGVEISFFKWMSLAVPLLGVMGVVLFGLLTWQHMRSESNLSMDRSREKRVVGHIRDAPLPQPSPQGGGSRREIVGADLIAYIRDQRARMGPWSRGELNTLAAFVLAITLWILPGIVEALDQFKLPWLAGNSLGPWLKVHLPESIVALSAAVLLFLLPVNWNRGQFTLTWRDAERIDWGTILLFGGGMALGTLMFETGVAKAMGDGMSSALGVSSLWGLTGLSIAMAIVISEAASNTASANMIIPVAVAISQSAGVSPLPPALGACLGASFGFMLPVSTPPNAIVYGSGLVPLGSMMRAGVLFDLVGFVIIWAGLRLLCPMFGLM